MKLSAIQHRAITELLSSKSVAAAAVATGVHERTLFRWMGEPDFRQALSDAEGALLDAATRRLLKLQEKALDTLEAALDGGSEGARLRAAQTAIEHMPKIRETRNLEQRLAELEQEVAMAKAEVAAFEAANADGNTMTIVDYRQIDYRKHLRAPDGYQHT